MRSLRRVCGLVAVALTVAGVPPLVTAQAVPQWALDHLAAWYKAFNAGDAAGVAALYSADAVVVPSGQPAVRGRAAIEAHHTKVHREATFSCSGGYDGFQIVAGTAVGWGHDTCTVTPRAGGTTAKATSRWIAVYERQPDGTWLIVRDVAEDTMP